jgi:hypothetical protein
MGYGKLIILPARMNPDLLIGDTLKNTGAGNLFMIFGEPDIKLDRDPEGKITVEIRGLDVYDPTTGQVRSSSTDDIACWFIDTDYNGECFFVRHAYFLGADEPYEKLKRALRAEIDETLSEALYSAKSQPFDPPKSGKIAVKVINHYGDEVLKVGSCAENGGSLCVHQDSEKAICHRLDVVRPQEDRHVLGQVVLADPAKDPQVVSQPGPDPLQCIVMHLADSVAVIVSCPLVGDVTDRRMSEAQLLEMIVGRPLVAVDHGPGSGRIADERLQRCPIGPFHHPRPKQAGVTPGHAGHRGPVVGEVAVATPLVGSSPGRVVGIGVKNAFFAGILVHLIGLDLRVARQ